SKDKTAKGHPKLVQRRPIELASHWRRTHESSLAKRMAETFASHQPIRQEAYGSIIHRRCQHEEYRVILQILCQMPCVEVSRKLHFRRSRRPNRTMRETQKTPMDREPCRRSQLLHCYMSLQNSPTPYQPDHAR